jgi:hypothetical protein
VLGDGVNLASRLEALGKHYGVTALVSEPVVRAAGDDLLFRRIDKVAVKGKSAAVVVYELLDPEDVAATLPSAVQAYEEALDDSFARRFRGGRQPARGASRGRRSVEAAPRALSPFDRRSPSRVVGRGLCGLVQVENAEVTGTRVARKYRRTRANERDSGRQDNQLEDHHENHDLIAAATARISLGALGCGCHG